MKEEEYYMKKTKQKNKTLCKTKLQFIKQRKELRQKFSSEINDIIHLYCSDCNLEKTNEYSGLSPVEILGVLELLKLNFFYEHEFKYILQEMENSFPSVVTKKVDIDDF